MGKDLLGNDLGKGFTQRKDLLYLARRKTKDYEVALSSLDIEVLRVDFALAVQEAERQAFIGKKLVVKTVNEWFYTWFEIFKGPSIRTKFQYQRRYVNTYGKYIGEDDILTVNAIYLQSITNKLLYEEKRSERGVRDALGSVKECFEAAVSVQIIPVNPAAPVKVGLETKSTSASFIASMNIKFLKRQEQVVIDAYLQSIKYWYLEMIQIMLLHGPRIGEVGGLFWDDIDFKKRVIHVRRALHCDYEDGVKKMFFGECKTANSYRDLPFSRETEGILRRQYRKIELLRAKLGKRWREQRPEYNDLVFWTTLGSPVTRYTAESAFASLKPNLNIVLVEKGMDPLEDFYPHMLRHTFATRCFELGMKDFAIQKLMGHSSIEITRAYIHVVFDTVTEEYKKMNCIFDETVVL